MSTAAPVATCPFCEQPLAPGQQQCANCHASADWLELAQAVAFCQRRFEQWCQERRVSGQQYQAIADFYRQMKQETAQAAGSGQPVSEDLGLPPRSLCWSCGAQRHNASAAAEFCTDCGAPLDSAVVRSLRFLNFLCHETKRHEEAGRLSLAQAHEFLTETRERIAGLRRRLEKERIPQATEAVQAEPAVRTPASRSPAPAVPRRPLWEILLDPRSIQWLLAFGGALVVIGLVIWLWAAGVFKNPAVVATALGAANAALLAGGWVVIRSTRYQTAGRALTLLACLIMPLNLWFYHANNLITLEGHLWVAALVCCVLYTASALVLRDQLFVYVLAGGVALTGLLILADQDVHKFWEIASPATLLVVLGLVALHAERAFPEGEGPFTRRRFGMAFFWSGQALLGAGLVLLLGAQVFGWLHPALKEMWNLQAVDGLANPPAIVTELGLRVLAVVLVLAGTYAYFYSDLVVRRVGVYIYLGVFTLLWAEVLVINLFDWTVPQEVVIVALALTALAANLLQPMVAGRHDALSPSPVTRAGQPLGLFLSTLPVLLGVLLHLRATYRPLNEVWLLPGGGHYVISWGYVGAMLVTAVSCRVGAHLYRRTIPWLSATYFFGTAAATLVGAAGLFSVLGLKAWPELAPAVMLIPILYMIAARLYRGHTSEDPLAWVGHTATAVMLVAVVAAALHLTPEHVYPVTGERVNLLLALFFAEASVFYALAAAFRKQGFNIYLCTAMACGAVWQLLHYGNVDAEYYTLTFALLGMLLLIAYRLAVLERFRWAGLAEAAFQCANALMSLSFVAAALLALSRLATQPVHWSLLSLLITLAALSLLAAWLVRDQSWRRWYIIMALIEALLTFVTLHVLSHLSVWQKLEIFSVVVGLALLVVGHLGWYREQERHNDVVSLSLLLGSVLAGLPLAIAVVLHRYDGIFSVLNELGLLVVGVVLLVSGFMFQLRSTTLVGGALVALYLVSLVLFIHIPEQIQTAALWLAIGGATIFTAGLLLSIYRDRLLTLPDRIKRREGVFRVLSWR
ncbi:MAG TPA: hypothetical protein VG013_18950 [Gemmataceae bacterium]|nr:hypothetical protein [Gemmataceae bacterium]